MIDDFERLDEGFTFLDSWDDPEITPETFRIYAGNFPAKEASGNFIYSVKKFTLRLIESKENQLICNVVCNIMKNVHLLPPRPVIFFIKK